MRIVILLIIIFSSLSTNAQSRLRDSVTLSDGTRQFVMYLPANIKKDAPLLLVTHGYGSYPKWPKSLSKAADKYGFAICAPQGYKGLPRDARDGTLATQSKKVGNKTT